MRFRLWHLFIAMTVLSIALFAIDQYARDTVIVGFSGATRWGNPYPESNPENADYSISFVIQSDEYPIDGFAYGNFGHNSLFATDITDFNVSKIGVRSVQLVFRRRSLPFLPATNPVDEMAKYFSLVLAFPNSEEWRKKKVRR